MIYETLLRVVAGVILLAGNAFFVATEFALTRVRQFDESEFQEHPGLQKAWEMTDELEVYLSGCQVGITVSSVALGVVAEPAIAALFSTAFESVGLTSSTGHSAISVIIALAVINLAHVIFGEQIPTYLGVERTKTISRYLAPLLHVWVVILGPLIRFADSLSKAILGMFGVTITRSWKEDPDDMRTIAELRHELGTVLSGTMLSEERKTEVLRALDISDTPVREIMNPVDDIRAPPVSGNLEDTITYIQKRPYTRYPLTGPQDDEFVGTLYTATVLQHLSELENGNTKLQDISSDLMVVTPDTPVSDLIDDFQQENQELALVANETSVPLSRDDVLGLVTTTDAFEAIAGDFEDPIDAENAT